MCPNSNRVSSKASKMDPSGLMVLMRPAHFMVTKKGDPEQILQEFAEYVKIFGKFLKATGMEGNHKNNHMNCASCQKAKAYLEIFGGKEVMRLFEPVRKVEERYSYQAAVDKVWEGIQTQTNQALGQFKLLNQIQQQKSKLAE